jgi:hypothetical protein
MLRADTRLAAEMPFEYVTLQPVRSLYVERYATKSWLHQS